MAGIQRLAAALLLLTALLSTGQEIPAELKLDSIEPDKVKAFQEFSLVLSGSGFTKKTAVYVQATAGAAGRPARYTPFTPEYVSSGELKVAFSFGFGLSPRERKVFVKNAPGETSNALTLTVLPPQAKLPVEGDEAADATAAPNEKTEVDAPESAEDPEPSDEGVETASPIEEKAGPRIDQIQPAQIAAGVKFSLLILGGGFREGAVLRIEANAKAGLYVTPRYEFREFPVDFLGDSILEVVFDRGFYHEPSTRMLFVVNPDGSESNRVSLAVVQTLRSPR